MEGWCRETFRCLCQISLGNPCTCISRHEKWHREIGFWGLKNFSLIFHFVCKKKYYIVIILKTLTEEIWDLTLRLNPVRSEVKSVKCYEYIKTEDSFSYHRVLSTLVFRLRWFRMLEIYQALAITVLCRRILISQISISRLPWISQS